MKYIHLLLTKYDGDGEALLEAVSVVEVEAMASDSEASESN